MLDFLGSLTPYQDLRAAQVVHNQWVLGSHQKYNRQLKFVIAYPRRGWPSTIAAESQSRNIAPVGIAKSGRTFVNFVLQILRLQAVNSNLEKLPLFFQKEGQQLQFAWDGNSLCIVPLDQKKEQLLAGPQVHGQAPKFVRTIMDGCGRALYRTFIPEQVRAHYLVYVKWKFLHRLSSSVIQVLCTQAMLQAIGIGARRSLPAAAGLNWVLKDGLGRLGRFAFSGLLGSTFDSNLKKVRFSTSVLFSLCLGLEMLTPIFPNYFLLFATIANIGRSIALAAYLATSSAIHKSFAVGDNLADIAAKGQVQTVVADNIGLAIAVATDSVARYNKVLEPVLLLTIFPILTGLDLFAIYQELQSVHLQTLNKARLEIIVDGWLYKGQVLNAEEVSKVECQQLLQAADQRTPPLRIGALNPQGWKREDILQAFQYQARQPYAIFEETQGFISFFSQPGLLLWLHDGFTARDAITAILQVGLLRSFLSSKRGSSHNRPLQQEIWKKVPFHDGHVPQLRSNSCHQELNSSSRNWASLVSESKQQADACVDDLIAAMNGSGWQTQHILLDPQERETYSTQLGI